MKRLRAFSLMEMMVVLLIVAIIAAASAPMISKKLVGNSATPHDGCWWILDSTQTKLHYAPDSLQGGQDHGKQVAIGAVEPRGSNPVRRVKFHVESDDRGQISLGDGSQQMVASLKGKDNSFYFNSTDLIDNKGENNTIIGMSSRSGGFSNNTLLGKQIEAAGDNTTAVGTWITPKGAGATILGSGIHAGEESIAIGTALKPDGKIDIINALGKQSIAIGSAVYKSESHFNKYQEKSIINSEGDKSIAIGAGAVAKKTNSIAIGSAIRDKYAFYSGSMDNVQQIATKSLADRAIAIGSGARARGVDSIAIGNSFFEGSGKPGGDPILRMAPMQADGVGSIAVGKGAVAGAESAIAIGRYAKAAVDSNSYYNEVATFPYYPTNANYKNAVAIGYKAKASAENAVAIGAEAKAKYKDQIVLGTEHSTVYIPGNLVVGGNAVLGTDRWNAWSAIRFFTNGTNDSGHSYLHVLSVGEHGDHKMYWGTNFGDENYFDSTFITQYIGSDRRLKNVGEEFKSGLEQIKKLEVFNFTYKKDPNKTPRVGIIAQDLQKIFPQAVMKGDDGFLRIRMEDMFYAVVNAIKELDAKITALKNNEIKLLQTAVSNLEKQNEEFLKQNEEFDKRIKNLEQKL